MIRERLKTAQSCQKSYADVIRRELEFVVSDWVFLKLLLKGVIRFWKKGKLSPRYISLYQISRKVEKVSYELDFPESLASIHPILCLC